ncbi:hypothetical protein ACP70R_035677 [Stipagrostis hirtigluma subsp. patula]
MAYPTPLLPATPPFFPSPCSGVRLSPTACSIQLSVSNRVVLVRWTPPPRGWFKLNFDGSVYHDDSRRASVGGIICDCVGHVALAFTEPTEHSTVGIVEALAMIPKQRAALLCVTRHGPRACFTLLVSRKGGPGVSEELAGVNRCDLLLGRGEPSRWDSPIQ